MKTPSRNVGAAEMVNLLRECRKFIVATHGAAIGFNCEICDLVTRLDKACAALTRQRRSGSGKGKR